MSFRFYALIAVALFASFANAVAQETRVNVRGTVAGFDGKTLTVKSKAGGEIVVAVPDEVSVATTKSFTLADVKPGMTLGVTTVKRADGAVVAIDVRPIPATAPQGLSAWDLAPDSTMTNAVVEGTVDSAAGQELVLNYKVGMVKALVVSETAMSQAVPGTRDDLKIGETVFVIGRRGADDRIVAARVQVSKDGIKPTQ